MPLDTKPVPSIPSKSKMMDKNCQPKPGHLVNWTSYIDRMKSMWVLYKEDMIR